MSANPNAVVTMPVQFEVAFAPTVSRASTNRTFTIRSLADAIAAEQPVPQDTVDAMREKYSSTKALDNAIKCLRPAIYPGQYPDGARVRTAQNIEGVTALVHDYDGRAGDRVTRADLLARCAELKIEVLVWDTYSSDDSGTTFRALYPLSKVLPVDCHHAAHAMLKELLGMAPGAVLPASQAYFLTPRLGRKSNPAACFGRPIDAILDFGLLEAITADITPAKQSAANKGWDELDMLDHMFDDAGKALYMRCIQAINPWSEDRGHWIGVIGAGLRGWGLTPYKLGHLHELNESEKAIIERLEEWSKNERPDPGCAPKYEPGCVAKEGLRLYSGAKKTGLRAIVQKAHDASPEGIEALLEGEEELTRLALTMLGHKPPAAEKVIDLEEIAEAVGERQANKQKALALAEQQALAIHNLPECFGHMRDWIVQFASKGDVMRHADLTPDYRFKIDPIYAILCVAQMFSVLLGGRVWVEQMMAHKATSLAFYLLRVAVSGGGKSDATDWMSDILGQTPYARAQIDAMSYSVGGFWPNAFGRLGHNVIQFSDEGRNLVADTSVGNMGANLKTLHYLLLTAFSKGCEGGRLEGPIYSTGGKVGKGADKRFDDVIEPHLNLHIIGTHDLIPQLSTDAFLANGFSARFIIRIDPTKAPATKEDRLAKFMRAVSDGTEPEGESLYVRTARSMAASLREFDDRLQAAGRGRSFTDLTNAILLDDAEGLDNTTIYKLASEQRQAEPRENSRIKISAAVAEVQAEAEGFFDQFTGDNELLEAIQNREAEKLIKLAAIFTLASTPGATHIDADITRYMMHILQMAQLDFIKLEKPTVTIAPRWVADMPKLKKELEPGGMLFEADADGVSTDKLRRNRAWRRLIEDIHLGDDDLKGTRQQAKQTLRDLKVEYRTVGKATRYFMVKD